jgi:c-di-GMP-binding flagellar brake protein YcgR
VSVKQRCSFYRVSKSLGIGRGIGFCDLDGNQTVCEGDLSFCEKPSDLKKYQSEQEQDEKDRRQYPRFLLDLPLEYRVMNVPKAYGGLVVNVSEIGLLIRSVKNMLIGTKLKIAVLFPKGYELANFEVLTTIVRKEPHCEEDWEGYEYGLKFIEILEEDRRKLRRIISGQFTLEKDSHNL